MPFGPWPGSGGSGGLKTLSAIYAFGLSDNPVLDNFFGMPAGNLRFPGTVAGVDSLQIGWFEANGTFSSSPPLFFYERLNTSVAESASRRYHEYVLNDPAWIGTFADLINQTWFTETISFGNDTTDVKGGVGAIVTAFGGRSWTSSGALGITYDPTDGTNSALGQGLFESTFLYNAPIGSGAEVFRRNGYGQTGVALYPNQHGIFPLLYTSVNWTITPSADDGVGFMFTVGDKFTGVDSARAMMSFNHVDSSDVGEWYIGLWALPPSATSDQLTLIAKFYPSFGLNMGRGGVQFPPVNSATFAVSDGSQARAVWDDSIERMMLSTDGGAYEPLVGARTSISYGYVAYQPLTVGWSSGGGGAFQFPYATISGTVPNPGGIIAEIAPGYKASYARITGHVAVNSLSSGGGGSTATTFEITQNGTGISVFLGGPGGVPNGATGFFDSGEILLSTISVTTAVSDSWGMTAGGTSPTGGEFTGWVTVSVY